MPLSRIKCAGRCVMNTIVKEGKELRSGYTTGSCATAASTAAAQMLLTQMPVYNITIVLPNGKRVLFAINDIEISSEQASCSVVKDAGDDPDVTDGIKIFAKCELIQEGIVLKGASGVGVVNCKGLGFQVGDAAINAVPRKMIIENVKSICEELFYENGLCITLYVPKGEEIAKKTFNPRLGIVGGISILGTTGIVEPMSEKALIDTIKLLIDKQKTLNDKSILLSPGNYGRGFCQDKLGLDIDKAVKCSNFIGEALDYARYCQFKKILLVGHVGKLVKLAGSIMNTHSKIADCRMEIFAAHAAIIGADRDVIKKVFNSFTTDEVIEHLEKANICDEVFESMMGKILFHLNYRLKNEVEIGVVLFNNQTGKMYQSKNVKDLVEQFI